MMKYILILSLLIAGCAQAQIPGYSGSNGNYWFKNNTFIQGGLTIPAGSNPALGSGQLGRSGALYYDSTGTDTGLYVSHGTHWVKVGGATSANNGTSLGAGGIVQLGGTNLDIVSGTYIRNNYAFGNPSSSIQYYNRLTQDSITDSGTGTTLNRVLGTTDPTYASPMISIFRNFKDKYGDTLGLQYGGAFSIFDRRESDSVSTIFGAYPAKRALIYNDKGVEVTNQLFPPRDSTSVYTDPDGRSSPSFSSLWGLGASWGYNINIFSAYPEYPLTGYNSVMDLQRVASRTRHHSITGSGGIAGYVTSWKHWQAAMDTTTASVGNYISKVTGYTAYGSTDITLGALGATKAQILIRTKVDSSVAFLALPQWRALNEVNNGYGFVATGDSDYNYMPKLRIAGGVPTKANGGSSDKALEVIGEARFMSTNYYKSVATMTSSNAVDPSSPGLLNFRLTDSTSTFAIGAPFGYGASMGLFGKNENTAVRGGIDINIPYGGNATFTGENLTAGLRINFYDNNQVLERRYYLQRRKAYIEVLDSISLQAPAYKFGGLPTGAGTKALRYNSSTGYVTFADTIVNSSGTSTPALTSVANIASSTAGLFHFIRIGNEISFSGVFSVTPTSGSVTTQIAFALPGTASNFTAANDLSGSGAAFGNTNVVCNIIADATNDRAQVEFLPSGTAAHTIWVSGHYTVK